MYDYIYVEMVTVRCYGTMRIYIHNVHSSVICDLLQTTLLIRKDCSAMLVIGGTTSQPRTQRKRKPEEGGALMTYKDKIPLEDETDPNLCRSDLAASTSHGGDVIYSELPWACPCSDMTHNSQLLWIGHFPFVGIIQCVARNVLVAA